MHLVLLLHLGAYIGKKSEAKDITPTKSTEEITYENMYAVKDDVEIYDSEGNRVTIGAGEVVLASEESYEKDGKKYRKIQYGNESGTYYYSEIEEKMLTKEKWLNSLEEDITQIISKNVSDKSQDNTRYVNLPKSQGKTLHMREEPEYGSDIIIDVPDGEKVTIIENEPEIQDGKINYVKVQYGDKIGYVSKEYLVSSEEIESNFPKKVVSVPQEQGTNLHMREKALYNSDVIQEIPNGSEVYMMTFGEIEKDGATLEYVKVKYGDKIGYVASGYLREIEQTHEIQETKESQDSKTITSDDLTEEEEQKIKLNNGKTITFTDGAEMSPELVEQFEIQGTAVEGEKESKIPEEMRGDIQVIGIKMGATGYGKKGYKYNYKAQGSQYYIDDNGVEYPYLYKNNVESLIKCEEMGKDYILYYYAQGVTAAEGRAEGKQMMENIENLKKILSQKGLSMEHCLAYAVDTEIHVDENGQKGRNNVDGSEKLDMGELKEDARKNGQLDALVLQNPEDTTIKVDKESITESIIATLQVLEENGYPAVLYTDAKNIEGVTGRNEEILFSIEALKEKIPDLKLWITSAVVRESHQQQVETIQQLLDENQTELVGIQKVLNDAYGKNHVLKVDYSTMTVEEYKKLVKEMKERNKRLQSQEKSSDAPATVSIKKDDYEYEL